MSKEFKVNTYHISMTNPFVVPHENLRGPKKLRNTHPWVKSISGAITYHRLTSGQTYIHDLTYNVSFVTNLSVKVVDSSSGFIFDRDYDVHRLPSVDHHVPRIAVETVGPVVVTLFCCCYSDMNRVTLKAIFNFFFNRPEWPSATREEPIELRRRDPSEWVLRMNSCRVFLLENHKH